MTRNFKLLLEETRQLGLSTSIIDPEKEVVEIWNDARKIIVREAFILANDPASASITLAKNKEITYRLWERAHIPFPRNRYFKNSMSFPRDVADLNLKFPVVFKKSNGKKSVGVRVNITTFQDLAKIVADSTGSFIIQEMVFGREYRLLLYKDRLLGALEHVPPQITGNGVDTIATLIGRKQADLRGKLLVDERVLPRLEENNLSLDSVLEKDSTYLLYATSCLSEGATSVDCTDSVHTDILRLARTAAEAVNLKLTGLDLMCQDISLAPDQQKIAFLEANSLPSLNIHYTPMIGKSRRVIKDILEDIFAA